MGVGGAGWPQRIFWRRRMIRQALLLKHADALQQRLTGLFLYYAVRYDSNMAAEWNF